MAQQKDVLNTREVSAITDYSIDRVRIDGVVHIPTQCLLEFIQQEDFIEILPDFTMWNALKSMK